IVGREESAVSVYALPSGKVVDEELGGRRVRIVRQRVPSEAADGVIGRFGDLRGNGAEPARLRPAVVVGEGEELPAGALRARGARGGRARVRLGEQDELQGGEVAGPLDPTAAVIDDDGFESIAGIVETRDGVEASGEDRGASIRGDHDREAGEHG